MAITAFHIDDQRNELFSTADVENRIGALLINFMERSSRERLSVSQADIEELKSARGLVFGLANAYFDMMINQAERRRSNLLKYSGIKLISLGEDCFSRTIATHWGLKPSAKLGEKSHPFDLAVHPLAVVAQMIESDFLDYMDTANLHYFENHRVVGDKKHNIYYNHESGEHFAADNFAQLREVYQKRIFNFRTDLLTSEQLLFLCHNPKPAIAGQAVIGRLTKALQSQCESKDTVLICINTWQKQEDVQADVQHQDGRHLTATMNVCLPYPGYVWHKPAHAFSLAGFNFETQIVDRIEHFLERRFDLTGAPSRLSAEPEVAEA